MTNTDEALIENIRANITTETDEFEPMAMLATLDAGLLDELIQRFRRLSSLLSQPPSGGRDSLPKDLKRSLTMSEVSRQVRDDEPLMIAWKAHQATEEFANTLLWAGKSNIGQLWACFLSGWLAAGGKLEP